jgi:hypothetical protein
MIDLLRENSNTDVLIFGLDTGRLKEEFSVGDLKIIPNFDLEKYLEGYSEDDVSFIVDNAKYGQFRPASGSSSVFFSPLVEDVCLIPFRLFKVGWISAMTIAPVIEIDGIKSWTELNITSHLAGQIWADSRYKITKSEIGGIQNKWQQLQITPKGYLEMALRRFSRSYDYIQHSEYAGTSELDDYWVDLVIALESITSKESSGGIKQNMARRISLLLGKDKAEQKQIDQKVREIYKQRCSIVHGDEKDKIAEAIHEKRFMEAEALRGVVRDTVNACIELLTAPSTHLVNSYGHRKKLPSIIDEKVGYVKK